MKKFFKKIGGFFAMLFGGAKKFEKFLIEHVDDAIAIVNKIKDVVNNPVMITLLTLLPGKYSNAALSVLQKIELVIDKVIIDLNIADTCLQKETFAQRVRCFIEAVGKLSPTMKDAVFQKFASLYTKYSSDTELKSRIVDAIVQNRYLEQKEVIL